MRSRELLAPGGDLDSIKAAIVAGANAVYCGVHKFNARNRATNLSFGDLNGILRWVHSNHCKLYLTLNIVVVESEIPDLIRLLNKLVNTSIDGVIIQDLGLFYLLSRYFKGLKIHASTQLTTHNEGQIRFLNQLNATRVNLSRELNLQEIKTLTTVAHQNGMLSEVFVHGSYCISFSGLCYMSSLFGGNSGNRGRCSQPCRERYAVTPEGNNFPLNLKDNSAFFDLKELSEAGVDSFKIEGRIKKFHYVYTVVESYNNGIDSGSLHKVFNRDFSNGYLRGEISRDMFTDNPRDHSTPYLAERSGGTTGLYDQRGEIRTYVKSLIDPIVTGKAPLAITVTGSAGEPLVIAIRTPGSSFTVASEMNLEIRDEQTLNLREITKRLKAINDTEYFIEHIELKDLQPGLFIPFSELTSLKNRILFILRDSKEHVTPVKIPRLKRPDGPSGTPSLLVLMSSPGDLQLFNGTSSQLIYQLPDSPGNRISDLITLFVKNRRIIPWFPPVIIGKDFSAAVRFLQEVHPEIIVTENSGIAYEADKMGIPWIAGPRMNIVNSYSLLCLVENFNCSGAFLSNEINRQQIQGIKRAENFKLYYSIYHPIELMISRQCLFQQVTGCDKQQVDQECVPSCHKSASLHHPGKGTLLIEKSEGNYHRIYNEFNYLNTDIVTDIPDLFTGFLIDLREIFTGTRVATDRLSTVKLFESLLKGNPGSADHIKRMIRPSTHSQYEVGI
jgi:putative protease